MCASPTTQGRELGDALHARPHPQGAATAVQGERETDETSGGDGEVSVRQAVSHSVSRSVSQVSVLTE